MLFKSLLLSFVGSLNILIATIVLVRDYKKLQNILLNLFTLSLAGWVIGIAGFLASNDAEVAFGWAKVYYSFPLLIAAFMPLFSMAFPYGEPIPRKLWVPILLGYLGLAIPLIASKSFVTEGLVYHDWGKEIVLNHVHYAFYSVYLLGCFGIGLTHTYLKSRVARGTARAQTRFYFFGFLITSFFGVLFNLILPWFGNYRLIWLGPLFTSSLVGAIAYAIIKHRMFDVRLVVVRSLAYLASLMAISVAYGFVVFGLAQVLFDLNLSLQVQITLSAATGVAALTFPAIKKTFDALTNKLFYRDAYDPQVFFDTLNRVLVSTIELRTLLQRTTDTMADSLRSQYCLISIKQEGHPPRIIGTPQKGFSLKIIEQVQRMETQQQTIITDDIAHRHEPLHRLLLKHNIAVVVRMNSGYRNGGDLGYVVLGPKKSGNPYTVQDIRVLEAAANELVIAVQNALRFEEIENFNATLQQKIDDATRKLRRTNEKLRKLDETKDDFISMASHQLRTPLTSIKGYVSMVLEGDAGKISPLQHKLLGQAFVSSQRMVYLISDLLNVSRLRTGKFIIEPVPTDLSRVVHEEVEQLRDTAKGRRLELSYHKPEHMPLYMLDETKLRQVVMNFIDNAIHYTPSGGKIVVTLADHPHTIEFTVSDTGIGVPKGEQHHLFSKFYRAQNAKQARPDGTGLGLFMAKKVVIAQGGATIFRSEPGKGSTFGFRFSKSHLKPAPVKPGASS